MLPIEGDFGKEDVQGLDQFSFYDQNHKAVGEISLFASQFDSDYIETAFDDCWRAWNILTDGANNGSQTNNPMASEFRLNHYIYIVNDGLTSVATESCKGYGGHMDYIYWVPGAMITNQSSLTDFYDKKPVRVIGIHLANMNDDDFIQLVHNIAKSVKIKKN